MCAPLHEWVNTGTRAGLLTFWHLPCRVVSNLIKGMGADRMGGLAELDGFLQARPPQEMPVSLVGEACSGASMFREGAVLGWVGLSQPWVRAACHD